MDILLVLDEIDQDSLWNAVLGMRSIHEAKYYDFQAQAAARKVLVQYGG